MLLDEFEAKKTEFEEECLKKQEKINEQKTYIDTQLLKIEQEKHDIHVKLNEINEQQQHIETQQKQFDNNEHVLQQELISLKSTLSTLQQENEEYKLFFNELHESENYISHANTLKQEIETAQKQVENDEHILKQRMYMLQMKQRETDEQKLKNEKCIRDIMHEKNRIETLQTELNAQMKRIEKRENEVKKREMKLEEFLCPFNEEEGRDGDEENESVVHDVLTTPCKFEDEDESERSMNTSRVLFD